MISDLEGDNIYIRVMCLETKVWIGMSGERPGQSLSVVLCDVKHFIFFVAPMLSDP